jgi:hypothetical protein
MPKDSPSPRGDSVTTPPYAAFVSFDALIRRAADEGVPATIDKSLLVSWGIATGNESGVLTTLRALGLTDDTGHPTDLYREIRLSPSRRIPALQRCIDFAYPGLSFEGRTIDNDRLHDYFVEERGLTGQMVSKAMRFYRQIVAATADEGSSPERSVSPTPVSRRPPQSPPVERTTTPRQTPVATPPRGKSRSVRLGRPERTPKGRTGSDPGITVQLTITPDIDEEALVALFRRVRRAWSRSSRPE